MSYMHATNLGKLFIPKLLPQLGNSDDIELESLAYQQLRDKLRRHAVVVPKDEFLLAYAVFMNVRETGLLYVVDSDGTIDIHYRGSVPLACVNRRRHSLDPRTHKIHLSYLDGTRGDVWNEIPFP